MRYPRKHFKKDGRRVAPPGMRLPRRRRFEPTLPTQSGITVRSQYEQICADYFHANNIEFQYEPLMLLNGRQFRPDFYLPRLNLFIEICGYGHFPFYSDRQNQKQEIYRKSGLKAVFIHYNGRGSLENILQNALANSETKE